MMILLLIYISLLLKFANGFGSYDKQICKQSDASCSHQLHNPNVHCTVKFINSTDCSIYSVGKTYDPFKLPFILQTYKDKDIKTLALNLTFPNPQFTSMTFHYKNDWYPEYHLCRSFHLDDSDGLLENEFIFWDCLIFHVSVVEGNFFTLELKDDTGQGGTYSLRIPTADDQADDINKYRTFFYIHKDYFHNTGRLIATLQAASFAVVSYNVSILSCISTTLGCSDGIPIVSYAIYESEFTDTEHGSWKTIDLGHVDTPGRYAVSVQLISPNCNANCPMSYSSVFTIPSNKILQIIGILAIVFFLAATCCLGLILKLKSKHAKHVERAFTNPISVLFIYHPNTIEKYKLLGKLKNFMQKECFAMPMLIDDMIGGENPNQWTEQNMISASKVIFFLPADINTESAMPIKKQYDYALNYFSGCNFPRKGDRFCYVRFSDSEKPSKTLYGLRSFLFVDDLPKIITWIHDETFIHMMLYWRIIAKNWPNYEVEDGKSTNSNYSELSNFNGILDEPKYTDSLLPVVTPLHHINDKSKIAINFDRDIPDVQTIT